MKNIFAGGLVLSVVGALAAFFFGYIDITMFGTIAGLLGTTFYGLYQKFSKDEVKKELEITERERRLLSVTLDNKEEELKALKIKKTTKSK